MIDHLDELEDSARIAHCLRAMPSLEELCLRGPGCWVTADFLHLLSCQANIDVLVPGLEVLEITDRHIPCYESVNMIESRWRARKDGNGAGSHLKRLRFEISWVMAKEWLVDADILNRLRKCRQEGMDISVIEQGGLPKGLAGYSPATWLHIWIMCVIDTIDNGGQRRDQNLEVEKRVETDVYMVLISTRFPHSNTKNERKRHYGIIMDRTVTKFPAAILTIFAESPLVHTTSCVIMSLSVFLFSLGRLAYWAVLHVDHALEGVSGAELEPEPEKTSSAPED